MGWRDIIMTRIGRNDPCPCGSGKKYKKCCMALAELVDPTDNLFTRYNKLFSMIKIKLDEAYSNQIKKARNEASQMFLRFTSERILKAEYESFFSDWLWFDKTDSEENTLGYHYLQTNGLYLDSSLGACLGALTLSYLSVYEVLGMEDEFLLVKDIFSEQEIKVLVAEPFDSPTPPLVLGRLVHMPEASIFSGMVLIMTNEHNRKEFLINHFNYIKEVTNLPVAELFKFNGNIIFGIFEHAYKKVMINLNDIRYTTITSEDKKQLISSLRNDENFEELYDLEDHTWFKPLNNNKGYVRIAVSDENVIISADVLEDVNYLQEIVSPVVPDSEFTVINSTFLSKPPEIDSADIWFAIIKDQESERWFNTPIADLDNKTPYDVLKEDDGKDTLLEMLNNLENSVATEDQKEFIYYLKQKLNKINNPD